MSRQVYNPITKRYYILRSRRTNQRRLKQIRELWVKTRYKTFRKRLR